MTTRICWEGPFRARSSLGLVNRELVRELARRPGLELTIRPVDGRDEAGVPLGALAALAAPMPAPDVTVRHAWPLDPHPPRAGRWVAVQPWEYGGMPRRFYEPFRFGVDEVWVPSEFNRVYYVDSGIPEERVRVVPNGVTETMLSAPLPFPLRTRKRFKFLFVGGTILRKGIDVLLDAYIRSFGPDDDVCLVIKDCGVGTYYSGQTYERFIRELQRDPARPEIEYIDAELAEEAVRDLYHACDCLVHPYRGEGFGLPIAEAMACGLPVIVPDQGAARDFCTPETALLVRSARAAMRIGVGWDPIRAPWWIEPRLEDLRARMREVYEDPASVSGVAARGRSLVRERLTWRAAAEVAEAAIAGLAAAPAPPRHADPRGVAQERVLEGVSAWFGGDTIRAIRHFGVARSLDPGQADAEYNLATALIAREDYRTAAPVLTGLASIADGAGDTALAAQALVMLGGCEVSLGRGAAADRALQRAAELDPTNADAPELQGYVATLDPRPTAVAERPGVRWRAQFFNASGYADEARNMVLGLRGLEWPVGLQAIDGARDAGILAPEDFRALTALLGAASGFEVDVQHVPPNGAVAPATERSVLRTMFETDRIAPEWVDVCNQFTEVWVPCDFNRETFARSGVIAEKIRVVPGSLDTALYDASRHRPMPLPSARGFRFVSVFDWTPRKGWDVLLRAYLEEFHPDEDVSLVIKATNFHNRMGPAEFVRSYLEEHGWSRPAHVEVIDRHLDTAGLISLYRAADAFVLPSRGEGWGRPYMEAMALGVPVIGTRWSGNLAFMNDENSYLIEIEGLEPADRQGWEHYRGHLWAAPSVESTREQMRRVYREREEARARAARASEEVRRRFGREAVARLLADELCRVAR